MHLFKYCEPQYNLMKTCSSIQLGTLTYFRESYKGDKDMIGDYDEGISSQIDENSNYFFNTVSAPNCFIFCLSTGSVEETVVKEDFDKNYLDSYSINDIDQFVQALRSLLELNLSLEDIELESDWPQRASLSFRDLKFFEIHAMHGPVNYSHNKFFEPFKSFQDKLHATIFTKLEKYKSQKEYRIAYLPYHPKVGYISVKKKPKILDTCILNSFIGTDKPSDGSAMIISNNFIRNDRMTS